MHNPPRILIVDDNETNRDILMARLGSQGYDLTQAADGEEALAAAKEQLPDLILLDIMMPKIDGIEVCKRIKADATMPFTPIILCTAKADSKDVVAGLEAGADDYQTKPFGSKELLARVNALLRRSQVYADNSGPDIFETGDLRIDFDQHLTYKAGRPVDLTPTEFAILALLARTPGEIVPARTILQKVWGPAYRDEVHLLRVNVARLRRKIEDVASQPRYVLTHARAGYSVAEVT
jgi:DNA-binding response OmpR family regulator